MKRVYLETSFFSACVWDRKDPKSLFRQDESRRWWLQRRHSFELAISAEVVRELSHPTFRNRENALALTERLSLLPLSEDCLGLAKILVNEHVMPGPAEAGDAIHVAISVVYGLDYLVTWNVRHLANPNKREHLQKACRRVGYSVPELVTPDMLWEPDDEE